MVDFTGKYKMISSDNFDAILKELGADPDIIEKVKNSTSELEITKAGNVYSIKTMSSVRNHEIKFEIGKEFQQDWNGQMIKTVVVADGNKLIQTQEGDKKMKIVREINGNELKVTSNVGSVTAVRVFKKN